MKDLTPIEKLITGDQLDLLSEEYVDGEAYADFRTLWKNFLSEEPDLSTMIAFIRTLTEMEFGFIPQEDDTAGYKCRQCGCTDSMACQHPMLGFCWWTSDINQEGPICSHCLIELTGVIRPWQQEGGEP